MAFFLFYFVSKNDQWVIDTNMSYFLKGLVCANEHSCKYYGLIESVGIILTFTLQTQKTREQLMIYTSLEIIQS